MDIIKELPFDLQQKIIDDYVELEKIRNLPRHMPLKIIQHFKCDYHSLCTIQKENIFEAEITMRCDLSNMVWLTCTLEWGSWSGCSSNMYNVPLMKLTNGSDKELIALVKLIKKCYVEYIRFNYTYSKSSFRRKESYYSLEYNNIITDKLISERCPHDNKLPNKVVKSFIKRLWFDHFDLEFIKDHKDSFLSFDSSIQYNAHPSISNKDDCWRFRLDDTCYDMGTHNIRIPYTMSNLSFIKQHLPTIFHLLQKHDHLWTPYRLLPKDIKEYVTLYTAYNDAVEKYHELHQDKEDIFKGYKDLMSAEEFNEEFKRIITNIGIRADSYGMCCFTKYIVPWDIHEVW